MSTIDRRNVAALAYDGLGTFELGIVTEVFGLPRPEMGESWYRFRVCSHERGPLRATGGLFLQTRSGLAELARAGTIIIPGWRVHDTPPAPLIAALRRAHARGARLVSICSGVFVLAATGLLDGRQATTHWRYVETLRSRYPKIRVEPDVLYIDEGAILTSAGSAAGIDLCLHLVRRDFGAEIANQVARRLVVPPVREGGQAQFAVRPIVSEGSPGLARLLEWAQAHLDRTLTVDDLAARANMSARTFARRFKQETGTTSASLAAAPADSERPATARKERPADRLDRRVGGPPDSSNAARTLSTDAQDDADRLPSRVLRGGATGPDHQGNIAVPIFATTVKQ
jgi:AraC family transcriptional activator FtrA